MDVLVCKIGTIAKRSLTALGKAGVVVIECANPDEVKFIRAEQQVSGDEMVWAALKALSSQPSVDAKSAQSQRNTFIEVLAQLTDRKQAKIAEGFVNSGNV